MKLKDMIIADGCIQKYTYKNDKLIIFFKDYSDNEFLFSFSGVTEIEEKGSIGYDLSEGKFRKNKELRIYEFYDDEGIV